MRLFLTTPLFLLFSFLSIAQIDSTTTLTPGGNLESVFDHYGNKYDISEIQIDTITLLNGIPKNNFGGSCGYFNVYYAQNSGMGNFSDPIHQERRDVICQLLMDISDFIIPADTGVTVNILVADTTIFPVSPSTANILGLASGFYVLPNTAPSFSGIADNEIWKTVNNGQDSYQNVTGQLTTPNQFGSVSNFYHGVMAFNFENSSINWHLDLTTPTSSGLYDLYTVALHEFTHALGFATLTDSLGQSRFGPDFPYYSRYDRFLQTNNGNPLLVNSGSCSMYNYEFNSSLTPTVLTSNSNLCSEYIHYMGSVDIEVYTPTTYQPGSSLSHFPDSCLAVTPTNEYYVMDYSSGTGQSGMNRYLREEERLVLCDLGYNVNNFYGNQLYTDLINDHDNNHQYSNPVCPGIQVAGINDGIDQYGYYT